MKELFYKVCFKHNMVSYSGLNRWVQVDNISNYTVGENVNYELKEIYHIEECECLECLKNQKK